MGAWAADAFGNDTACDWAGGFADNPSLESLRATIDGVLKSGQVGSHASCVCLAACEVVARLKDNWGARSPYSDRVDAWVESTDVQPSTALVEAAERAIIRILGEDSELRELWMGDEEWHAEMNALLARVRRSPVP